MRCLPLFTVAGTLVAALACTDATAPPAGPARDAKPVQHSLVVPSITPQIAGGDAHTCALKPDGTVLCWGNNTNGQSTPPAGLNSVAQLALGASHSCALKTDGSVTCWGRASEGQTTVPVGLTSVAQVTAGGYHSCALKTDGTVTCWGYNAYGQSTPPAGLNTAVQITSFWFHTCALKSDATVTCWGQNASGQTNVPVGLTDVAKVSAGYLHTCALKTNATVVCWGQNNYGQSTVPSSLVSAMSIGTGANYSCALTTDGAVVCWGLNSSGQGTEPAGVGPVVQMSIGGGHTCVVKTNGGVACWGYNGYGQTNVPAGLSLATPTTTATLLVSDHPSSSTFGDLVTFTATVTRTSDGTPASGSVRLIEGATCAPPNVTVQTWTTLNSAGQATLSSSALIAGTHSLKACYSSLGDLDPSEASITQVVTVAATSTSASTSVSVQQYSDRVTLSANITPASFGDTPAVGSVQFQIDGVDAGLHVPVLAGGHAELAGYPLTQGAGNHVVTAIYTSTHSSIAGSTSSGIPLTVETENALITFEGVRPRVKGPSGKETITLDFVVNESTPDLSYGSSSGPGDITLANLAVTLVPLEDEDAPPLALDCQQSFTTGDGYDAIQGYTCQGSNFKANDYQVVSTVTGAYYRGTFSQEIKPGH